MHLSLRVVLSIVNHNCPATFVSGCYRLRTNEMFVILVRSQRLGDSVRGTVVARRVTDTPRAPDVPVKSDRLP